MFTGVEELQGHYLMDAALLLSHQRRHQILLHCAGHLQRYSFDLSLVMMVTNGKLR